jgi:hypothetical protein
MHSCNSGILSVALYSVKHQAGALLICTNKQVMYLRADDNCCRPISEVKTDTNPHTTLVVHPYTAHIRTPLHEPSQVTNSHHCVPIIATIAIIAVIAY